MFPGGAFWAEMQTISQGTDEGTGASRWELWTGVGWRVFLHSPIFGVGANNKNSNLGASGWVYFVHVTHDDVDPASIVPPDSVTSQL